MPSPTRRQGPARPGRSRDRRGRGLRGPLAWPPIPAMRTRAQAFDDLVLDTMEAIEEVLHRPIAPVEIAVEDVPTSGNGLWELGVPLARVLPQTANTPPRVVVYRRAVESRVEDPGALADLVYEVVAEQVAVALGLDPEDFR